MNNKSVAIIGAAFVISACSPQHNNFITNTGYETAAKDKTREFEQRVLGDNYLVSCAMITNGFADCVVIITPNISAYAVYCQKSGCLAKRIHPLYQQGEE